MIRLRILPLIALVLLSVRPVAAQGFVDGNFQTVEMTCPASGSPQSYAFINATAGYFADAVAPYPRTGAISYVRAVAYNVHPCLNELAVGFEFFLPDGASLAISATTPVYCVVGVTGQPPSENVAPNYGTCSQTPQVGIYGGHLFGFSAVAPGWYADFRVPVVFNKKLLGIGGPTSHRLTAAVRTSFGDVFPYVPVITFYQASFDSLATTGITASTATLAFNLNSYFESGTLFIDYGTTASLGSSLAGTLIPNSAASFPASVPMSGLAASTTYYWRARFVTSSGTFTSSIQSFTTSAGVSSYLLTVAKGGTGAGTVTSSPAGIACGATCTANFSSGTMVTLTATPATGSRLASWGGACSGSGACVVTMSAAQTVNASFMREIGSLSVTLDGLPSGTTSDLNITGPDGYNATMNVLTGTGFNLSDVVTGQYAVTAPNITVNGLQYTAPTQQATVNFGQTATINVLYTAPTSPPTNVTATAIFVTAVEITWIGVKGVTYEVHRTGPNGAATTVGTSTSGSFTDKTAAANTAYLYKARAILPSVSQYSAPDLATTVTFTDATLTAQSTAVKEAHITQLRTAVNAVRALAGLGAGTYTDPTLIAGVTVAKAAHVMDLRTALAQARALLSLPTLTFATPSVTPGLFVSATNINELRLGVR